MPACPAKTGTAGEEEGLSMTAVETERLTIRSFREEDWRDLQEMAVQYEASEYAVYDHQWPTDEEGLRGAATWFASGDGYLAVCLKPGGKVIGLVVLNEEEGCAGTTFGLGYVFNFEYHGKGYATEACAAMLHRAFAGLGAERVTAGTAAANLPSCRLLERLGLKRISEGTGHFRKTAEGVPIEFLGYMYAISRLEWEEAR